MKTLSSILAVLILTTVAGLPATDQYVAPAGFNKGATATPGVVQTCNGGAFGSGQSVPCAFGSNTTSGDILVVTYANVNGTSITFNTPTGCTSGSWTLIASTTTTRNVSEYMTTASGGACTVAETTGTGTSSGLMVGGYEINNVIATTDGVNATAVSFCTTCNGPLATPTPTVSGDMVLSFIFANGTSITVVESGSFTQDVKTTNGTCACTVVLAHFLQSSAASVRDTWTSNGATFMTAIAAIEP